jgi:hypothetical protein
MRDENFRKALNTFIEENDIEEDIIILEDHAYDRSIVGLTADCRLVYDFDRMVEEFAEDEGCDETEAIEWLEYNTMRAVPYMGERAPIILTHTRDTILDFYG